MHLLENVHDIGAVRHVFHVIPALLGGQRTDERRCGLRAHRLGARHGPMQPPHSVQERPGTLAHCYAGVAQQHERDTLWVNGCLLLDDVFRYALGQQHPSMHEDVMSTFVNNIPRSMHEDLMSTEVNNTTAQHALVNARSSQLML